MYEVNIEHDTFDCGYTTERIEYYIHMSNACWYASIIFQVEFGCYGNCCVDSIRLAACVNVSVCCEYEWSFTFAARYTISLMRLLPSTIDSHTTYMQYTRRHTRTHTRYTTYTAYTT